MLRVIDIVATYIVLVLVVDTSIHTHTMYVSDLPYVTKEYPYVPLVHVRHECASRRFWSSGVHSTGGLVELPFLTSLL